MITARCRFALTTLSPRNRYANFGKQRAEDALSSLPPREYLTRRKGSPGKSRISPFGRGKRETGRGWRRRPRAPPHGRGGGSPGGAPPNFGGRGARSGAVPPRRALWSRAPALTHQLQRAEEDERAAPRAAAHGGSRRAAAAPRSSLPRRCGPGGEALQEGVTASGQRCRGPLPSTFFLSLPCFCARGGGGQRGPAEEQPAAGGSARLRGRGRGRGWACAGRGGKGEEGRGGVGVMVGMGAVEGGRGDEGS